MKNILVLLIFSLVLLFSCEDVIELDLPDKETCWSSVCDLDHIFCGLSPLS